MSSSWVTLDAVAQDDAHLHLVLGVLGRHRERRRLDDVGMLVDERLDLERRDVLAAAADGVLDAVDEVVVAVGVDREPVTGVEPAVAPRGGAGLGHAVVPAVDHPRLARTHDELADLVGTERLVVLVDDLRLVARPTRPQLAAALVVGELVAVGRERRADLGHAVARADLDAEAALELVDLRARAGPSSRGGAGSRRRRAARAPSSGRAPSGRPVRRP